MYLIQWGTYLELNEVSLGGADLHLLVLGGLEIGSEVLRDGLSDLSLSHAALHGLSHGLGESINLSVDSSHSLGSAGLNTGSVSDGEEESQGTESLDSLVIHFINYKNKTRVSLYFLD